MLEEAGGLPLGELTGAMGNGFSHKMYMFILYLWYEATILAILCTGIPITTTIAGE